MILSFLDPDAAALFAGKRVSIRINDQFRLCFVWTPDGVQDVEIVDYH